VGYARAGTTLFWKGGAEPTPSTERSPEALQASPRAAILAVGALIGGTVLLSVLAGPITRRLDETAAQLLDRRAYVGSVLGEARVASVAGSGL
jgi:multicomponent K+:H+ antiporter subunit D